MVSSYRGSAKGLQELLKTEAGIHALISSATADAGDQVRDEVPTRISGYVLDGVVMTDRPQGNVTIAVKSAEALEGKYGYLARAAAATGFEGPRKKGSR